MIKNILSFFLRTFWGFIAKRLYLLWYLTTLRTVSLSPLKLISQLYLPFLTEHPQNHIRAFITMDTEYKKNGLWIVDVFIWQETWYRLSIRRHCSIESGRAWGSYEVLDFNLQHTFSPYDSWFLLCYDFSWGLWRFSWRSWQEKSWFLVAQYYLSTVARISTSTLQGKKKKEQFVHVSCPSLINTWLRPCSPLVIFFTPIPILNPDEKNHLIHQMDCLVKAFISNYCTFPMVSWEKKNHSTKSQICESEWEREKYWEDE